MLSSSSPPEHSPENVFSAPPENGSSPSVHAFEGEPDARTSLALFEGESSPEEDEGAKNGETSKNGALEGADDASIRDFYAQLVSLLTHENAPPATKAPARGSLRFALKRRALPALVVAGLTFAGLSLLLKPRQVTWTAGAQLLLPPRPAEGAGDPFAPPETSYDTAAQVALMGSERITLDAFERVPAELRARGWGTTALFAPPVAASAASPDGSGSLVEISAASSDEEASIALVREVIKSYTRSTQTRSTQTRDDNLKRTRARVALVGAQLERARQERANLKIRTGVGNASVAQNNAATNILSIQTALDAARRDAVSGEATDATLAGLQEQLLAAQSAYAGVVAKFFEDSEEAKTARAVVERAQNAIGARQSELRSQSTARIAQLEASLRRAQSEARALPLIERQQSQLDERISVLESAYRAATERQNQLGLARDAIAPVATITHSPGSYGSNRGIQRARALFVALLGALGLGLLAAMLLDRLDKSVRATSNPEALWNAPVLGALPSSSEADAFFRASPSGQKGNPRAKTQSIEACYLAQSNILALAAQSGARSIVFSSALESEGKATTAANLAVAMAYGGRETLLIDADFWNPTQHKNFGVSLSPGYAQVLRDGLPLSEAIRPTTVNNLYVLSPGQDAGAEQGMNALMGLLQGAPHLKNMALLKKYFDVIVVDGPPATTLGQAQLVSHLADAVVLVSAENTSRAQVQRARSMLRLSGAFLLGVVVNRVRSSEVADWNLQFTPEAAGK